MNTLQFVITIYIRPDKGPISEMQLDLLSIETAVMRAPGGVKSDDARLEMIATQIKAKFPEVEPQRKMNELRLLIARLSQISLFDGVVLRLPGTIPGDMPVQQAFPSVDIVKEQREQIEKLINTLETREKELDAALKMPGALDTRLKWFDGKFPELNEKVVQLEKILQEKDIELEARKLMQQDTFKKADAFKQKANKLEQEQAKIQTEIEQAKRDRKEIAQLRQRLASASKAEQQTREAFDKSQKDLNDCRNRVRQMADQMKQGAGGQGDPYAP